VGVPPAAPTSSSHTPRQLRQLRHRAADVPSAFVAVRRAPPPQRAAASPETEPLVAASLPLAMASERLSRLADAHWRVAPGKETPAFAPDVLESVYAELGGGAQAPAAATLAQLELSQASFLIQPACLWLTQACSIWSATSCRTTRKGRARRTLCSRCWS